MNIVGYLFLWACAMGALGSLAICFFPAGTLRMVVQLYPKGHDRRRELPAELPAIPRTERFTWVAQQIETAVFEGIPERIRARRRRQRAQMPGATRALTPLGIRGGLILIATCLTIALDFTGITREWTRSATVLPALLLLCVAAMASFPQPGADRSLAPTMLESMATAMIVGAIGPPGALFMIYLVIPLFLTARRAGLLASLACSLTGAFALVSLAVLTDQLDSYFRQPELFVPMATAAACIFILVPVLGSWLRRITRETARESEFA